MAWRRNLHACAWLVASAPIAQSEPALQRVVGGDDFVGLALDNSKASPTPSPIVWDPIPTPRPRPQELTCAAFGCSGDYVKGQPCQCNGDCLGYKYESCCSDYKATCETSKANDGGDPYDEYVSRHSNSDSHTPTAEPSTSGTIPMATPEPTSSRTNTGLSSEATAAYEVPGATLSATCDASCSHGCSVCNALCAGCQQCSPSLLGPFGPSGPAWCNERVNATADAASGTLSWPAPSQPAVAAAQGHCTPLCYEIWASASPEFSTYAPFSIAGSEKFPMASAGGSQYRFFKVRSIEMTGGAGVTHSTWSNVVDSVAPNPKAAAIKVTGSNGSATVITTTTTSPSTSPTTTSTSFGLHLHYTGPTTYIPTWRLPTSANAENHEGALKAGLGFVVPTGEVDSYTSADAAAPLRSAVAAMLGVPLNQVEILSISAAVLVRKSISEAAPRRLTSSASALRLDYLIDCASETERAVLAAKQDGLDEDVESREAFSRALAADSHGLLDKVNPESISTVDRRTWSPPPADPDANGGHVVDTGRAPGARRRSERSPWFTIAVVSGVLAVCCVLALLRPWKALTTRGVQLLEQGALPPGAVGFRPGHFAEVSKAARIATTLAGASQFQYVPVPTQGGFVSAPLPEGGAHYNLSMKGARSTAASLVPAAHGSSVVASPPRAASVRHAESFPARPHTTMHAPTSVAHVAASSARPRSQPALQQSHHYAVGLGR